MAGPPVLEVFSSMEEESENDSKENNYLDTNQLQEDMMETSTETFLDPHCKTELSAQPASAATA